MALFSECMPLCAQIVLDIADIVRDRDVTPIDLLNSRSCPEGVALSVLSSGHRVRRTTSFMQKRRKGQFQRRQIQGSPDSPAAMPSAPERTASIKELRLLLLVMASISASRVQLRSNDVRTS